MAERRVALIVIAATAATTALGNLEETWQALMAGRSALAPGQLDGSLGKWPVGAVKELSGRIGLSARQEQLVSLVLGGLPEIPVDAGLVMSTTGAPIADWRTDWIARLRLFMLL